MEPLEPDDPRRLGGYQLLRRLGAGGMGRVYLGRTAGGRHVAVKVIRADLAEDAEFRARFRQEVAAARRVGGRWTAAVLDADLEGRPPWVATGYVAGPALSAAVRDFGPLPAASVRALGAGLAQALAAVHGLGLVHRDVKPSNVLLTLDGPLLIDFGIARALDAGTALTRSGHLVGSPGFMSPEQAQGVAAGPASDVFSLGALLAYAATGVPPFGEGDSNPYVLLYNVLHEEPRLDGLAELDPGLHATVLACLAKDPAGRLTPARLGERLDPAGAGTARPGGGTWLPAALAAAVGRQAVELLHLDHGPEPGPDPGPSRTRLATTVDAGPGARPRPAPGNPPAGYPSPSHTPTQPYHPAQPHPHPQVHPQAPLRAGRRWPAVLGASVLVAVVAVGATLWLSKGAGSSTAGRSATASGPTAPTGQSPTPAGASAPSGSGAAPAAAPSSATPASGGAIPQPFLGSWKGDLTAQGLTGSVTYRVTLRQGTVGQVVADATSFWSNGTTCTGTDYLVSASPDEVVLMIKQLKGGLGCIADDQPRVYTRNSDGSLHLDVDGGSGDLTRVS